MSAQLDQVQQQSATNNMENREAATPKKASLLGLPLELRQMIYSHAGCSKLAGPHGVRAHRSDEARKFCSETVEALINTCGQIRDEVAATFYQQSQVRIEIRNSVCTFDSAQDHILSFLPVCPKVEVVLVIIDWFTHYGGMDMLEKMLTGLRGSHELKEFVFKFAIARGDAKRQPYAAAEVSEFQERVTSEGRLAGKNETQCHLAYATRVCEMLRECPGFLLIRGNLGEERS